MANDGLDGRLDQHALDPVTPYHPAEERASTARLKSQPGVPVHETCTNLQLNHGRVQPAKEDN